jgi:hypothetical protein
VSEPVSYQTKDPHTVQAMQYNAWDGTTDVKDWITTLLQASFEAEIITLYDNNNGGFQVIVGEDFLFDVNSGQYVYLDEDGFHSASAAAFEIYYKQVPAA